MEWFESWFESPYYHVLYKNRDYTEAQNFLNKLLEKIHLSKDAHILDLACGKGRHSVYLNSLGYHVTGADLSSYNIEQANKLASASLNFMKHDMREVIEGAAFDAVFNVFTSFGYFQDSSDNQKVVNAVFQELKPGGTFVLDFLNASYVVSQLVSSENKHIDGIDFTISRELKNGFIIKHIEINDGDQKHTYHERVQAFTKDELIGFFETAGLSVEACFGNYALEPFEETKSDRIILVAHKPQ